MCRCPRRIRIGRQADAGRQIDQYIFDLCFESLFRLWQFVGRGRGLVISGFE
jgi:hypothetical protein